MTLEGRATVKAQYPSRPISLESEDWSHLAAVQERSYARASGVLLASYPQKSSMNAAELSEFLGRKKYAVLATSRADGRAHAAPVGFTVWRRAFWVATVEGTKARNLRSRPWASIVVIEGEPPATHKAVIAEGHVVLHGAEDAASAGLSDRWAIKHGSRPDWANVFGELLPERVFSYDGGKGGTS